MKMAWHKKNGYVYLFLGVALLAIFFTIFSGSGNGTKEISFSEVVALAERQDVQEIVVRGDDLTISTRLSGEVFSSRKEQGASLVEILQRNGINPLPKIIIQGSSALSGLFRIVLNFLPLIFFGAVLLFMMRQAQGQTGQTFNFGRSKAKVLLDNHPTVSFADVAGVDEAKDELTEVVDFLKEPNKFLELGARIPRGVLLVGPPGTGKTLLAKAVAGEAKVPFFTISGSEFVEMFVGVGASRVRDLFDQAKKHAPCIVFVDEIDAVGRHRGAGLGGGHDEREQTLNQILVEMDGFDTKANVIVIAATNRPDILDPALLRPGRFDRRVTLDAPDTLGRVGILKVHVKGKPMDDSIDLQYIAKQTPGFSGADLANLVNEAALLAARRDKNQVTIDEFMESIDSVIAGPARKSRVITQRERKVTAFHESGHAVVGYFVPHADPVAKITIISRGAMGGYTRFLPKEDRNMISINQFHAQLAVAMGGRVAEEMVFGADEITTGASNDLENATKLARNMVTRYGMSKKLGPATFGNREELVFLGKEVSEKQNYGHTVAEKIDSEVNKLLEDAYKTAKEILKSQKSILENVANYLLEHETVEGDDLTKLLKGELASSTG